MQITRTTRLRLMTLHLRHIFFTDAITFIALLPTCAYLARKTILARDRSYGVSSTVTLSPGRMRM